MTMRSWARNLFTRAVIRPVCKGPPRARLAVEELEGRWVTSAFTVNSTGDSGSGLFGDLRYCINQANSNPGPDTITFDSVLFGTPQTITLTNGQLELTDTS